jgi:hypothetical protein
MTASLPRHHDADPAALELVWRGRRQVRPVELDDAQAVTYRRWLQVLSLSGVPYALGGAYAFYAYTGAWRDSKDLDAFLEPRHLRAALDAFQGAGYETEVRDRLWLAKVHEGRYLLDLLFAVRHSTAFKVDARWFETAVPVTLLGVPSRILGLEELIATKIYLAARDRFDGADIVHLIREVEGRVDWGRVVDLLHGDDEILLWHLVLFGFVYPGHLEYLPQDLMDDAFRRLRADRDAGADPRRFRGMLLDPEAFAVDVRQWGYGDCREHAPLVDEEGNAL